MKKIILAFLFFIAIIFLFFFFYPKHVYPTAKINNHTFSLEIATTEKEKETGLSKYTAISQNQAMYFPFLKSDYYVFWMKGMHFPIDIIFIRSSKVVTIYNSVPYPKKDETDLPTYKSTTPADSVLEISAGLAKKYGFTIGDSVIISY